MPTFSFFSSSRRKDKRKDSNASATSSFLSSSVFSSRSTTPDLAPPTLPQLPRRGSEPAAPFSHGFRSKVPPIHLYSPVGPSISDRSSTPMLHSPRLGRRGSDTMMKSPMRRRGPSPLPISPPRPASPPLPPHPAMIAASSSAMRSSPQRVGTGRAASYNHARQPHRPAARPRSRSFGPVFDARPLSIAAPNEAARSPPVRPPRPDHHDADFLVPPPRRPATKPALPKLDDVWAAFLEEAGEDLDTLSDLPSAGTFHRAAVTSAPPTPVVSSPQRPTNKRSFSEPGRRPVPSSPLQEALSVQITPERGSQKPPTPPATPAYPRYSVPSLSPLEALDVSLAMTRSLPSAPSKASLSSMAMSSAPSNLSMMSLQDALNYSISLSAFPKPPVLDSVREESMQKVDVEGDLFELPYLAHLPTPPISPPNFISIGKTGTVRAPASTPTLNRGRIAIPSFGTILDASKGRVEVPLVDEGESSSDDSHSVTSRFSPSSLTSGSRHRRPFERNDSFSSISTASEVVEDLDSDDDDCTSNEAYEEHTMHITPRPSYRSRSSFEFDEPQPIRKVPAKPAPALATKARMEMELPPLPFVANMDIGPLTPKMGDRSPSQFHVGWSPAPGTVEYGYAV